MTGISNRIAAALNGKPVAEVVGLTDRRFPGSSTG
jgi:hypothetical protein